MAYEKLGFEDKVTPLDAAHFNHMEGGIETANSVLETTTTNEITWDGNIGGRTYIGDPETTAFVHVSDHVPESSVFTQEGCTVTIAQGGAVTGFALTAEDMMQDSNYIPFEGGYSIFQEAVVVVFADNQSVSSGMMGDVVFPKKGVYFTKVFVAELNMEMKALGITSPLLGITATKIKETSIPDSIPRKPISLEWDNVLFKPFETKTNVLFEHQSVAFEYSEAEENYRSVGISLAGNVTGGQRLNVYFDGALYVTTIIDVGAVSGIPGAFSATIIPDAVMFVYISGANQGFFIMQNGDTSPSHEIGIIEADSIVSSMIMASSTEGSTKKFRLTVDDSCTISATEVT